MDGNSGETFATMTVPEPVVTAAPPLTVIDKIDDPYALAQTLNIPGDVKLTCLQYVGWKDGPSVIKVIRECMPVGAVLTVEVDDLDAIALDFIQGKPGMLVHEKLWGKQAGDNDTVRAGYTRRNLAHFFREAGFRSVRVESIGGKLIGRGVCRPETPKGAGRPSVIAIISLPRICPTEFFENTFTSLAPLGIRIERDTGAIWEQSLSRMLYRIVDNRQAKYILTLDYDSGFKTEHVVEMIELMEDNPDADAIFPVQMKRESRTDMLAGFQDEKGNYVMPTSDIRVADLTPATTGHFGLTLLRVESLARLPQPWFHGTPGFNGRWEANKVDPDISFWQNMRKAKMKVFLANRVKLGHQQWVMTWPKEDETTGVFMADHQLLTEYERSGPPDYIKASLQVR